MKLHKTTVNFYHLSDLFQNKQEALNAFNKYQNHDFSFGNNNRTLITNERLVNAIENIQTLHNNENEQEEIKIYNQLQSILNTLNNIPQTQYFDLES